jgi:hypothetical protein
MALIGNSMERFFFCGRSFHMARARQKHDAAEIFDNILFLAEVFGDQRNEDIPPLPILEMARCFELASPAKIRANRRRRRDWPLWK